jgi:hypothetical protein
MASEAQMLTPEEFASLLRVADLSAFRNAPAVIPADHSDRLIALGYMVDLEGRLRMTTAGRVRIYAGQLASEAPLPHKDNREPEGDQQQAG